MKTSLDRFEFEIDEDIIRQIYIEMDEYIVR